VSTVAKARAGRKARPRFGETYRLAYRRWGLAFKPGTTTCARPPSREVIAGLLARARASRYDPAAMTSQACLGDERDRLRGFADARVEGTDAW